MLYIKFTKDHHKNILAQNLLAQNDPNTLKFLCKVNNDIKRQKTKENYLYTIKHFIKYSISVNFNPFHKNLSDWLIIYFLLYRINTNDTKCWNSEISAISWLCELLGTSLEWKKSENLKNIKFRLEKLFFKPPNKANPIFIDMIIKYFELKNFSIKKAHKIPFNEMTKYLLISLYATNGFRGMELLKYKDKKRDNGLKFNHITFVKINKDNISDYFEFQLTDYKNAKSRQQTKSIIIGDSFHERLNPLQLFRIYLARYKKRNFPNKPSDHIFRDNDNKIITLDIMNIWIKDMLLDLNINIFNNEKFTLHGLRSALATWLRAMNLPIEQICQFVGWSDKFLHSAAFGYMQFQDFQKANLMKKIVNFKPTEPLYIPPLLPE